MAPTLLAWELTLPGSRVGEALERVTLADDGHVTLDVVQPGNVVAPELGWWDGQLDASALASARALAEAPWPFDSLLEPPSAAGVWWVEGPSGRLGLWSATSDDYGGAAVRGQLEALQSVCSTVASDPRCVARFKVRWAALHDTRFPMLLVDSLGRERLALCVDDAPDVPSASFMNDDGEVLGFTGTELWVPGGTTAFALLRDREPGPAGLALTGWMADEAGTRLPFALHVTVSDV